ncbi:MAG TPA: hypothetical protein VG013_08070, partial [Gemmataceae bacterium]|nr:hypothetical protein [Gemmataceae bacterium]
QPLTATQQATVVLSHEVSEAITDPDTRTGWLDPQRGEIGDITVGQVGIMHGYAVQALWSQADGRAVMPTDASATFHPLAGSPVHATAGPLRGITATMFGADPNAAVASFTAAIIGDGSAAGSQGQAALLTALSQGTSGRASAPMLSVALPAAAAGTAFSLPSGPLSATALQLSRDARVDSGGDDSLPQALKDEPPAARSQDASPQAAASGPEREAGAEVQSGVDLWREASTAYFAEDGRTGFSEEGDTLVTSSAVEEATPASNPGAAAAGLALVLGNYWNTRPALTATGRRLAGDPPPKFVPKSRSPKHSE